MITELEKALYYAGEGKDIDSLKALARGEAQRAERMREMLCRVLLKTGPVQIEAHELVKVLPKHLEFTMAEDRFEKTWTLSARNTV